MITQADIIRILLDNPTLKEQYKYSDEDIKNMKLSQDHENEFIKFVQNAVPIMDNEDKSIRACVTKLIKTFDT